MVTITACEQRKNAQGEPFMALVLTGDLEIVTSKISGKPYATVHKISIPSTLDESIAQKMIGKQLRGEIQKVECEPYDYTSKKTGEILTLTHQYVYNPNPSNLAEVIEGAPAF